MHSVDVVLQFRVENYGIFWVDSSVESRWHWHVMIQHVTANFILYLFEKVVYKPSLRPPEFFFCPSGLFFEASVLFIIHNVFCAPSPFIPSSLTFRKRWTAWQLCLYHPLWSNAFTCSSTCLTWPRPLWDPPRNRLRHHHQPPRRRPQARAIASRSFPWLTAGRCSRKSSSR